MKYKKILWVLLAALLLFIWGHSLAPAALSAQESGKIAKLLTPFLELFLGKGQVSHYLIRKLAHVTEFTALGAVVALLLLIGEEITWRRVSLVLSLGLTTAFLDESIQMLSDRGDQIKDVWIDLSGVLLGMVFVLLMIGMFRRNRRRRRRRKRNKGSTA